MDPMKFIELQKQMRENNEEVANFLSDFGSWKEQVERKNSKMVAEPIKTEKLPAIRNSLFQKRKKKRKSEHPISVKSTPRLKPRDFKEWDKIDIEEALKELDEEEQKAASAGDESSETDEELEDQRRFALAKEARELGNLRFKENQFSEAVEHYTTAVRLTPEDPVPYINRALAHLKLDRFASAEVDCSAALALDATCVKALFRRALARKGLDNKSGAIEDLRNLLKINKENKAAQKELDSLVVTNGHELSDVPSKQLSNKPCQPVVGRLRRIPIVEVGGSEKGGAVQQSNQHPVAGPKNESDRFRPDDVPTNWYQLERELRELCGSTKTALSDAAVKYLCAISPTSYVDIIGNNLEPDFMAVLLRAFRRTTSLDATAVASRLWHLSKLPRFDVAWFLLDDSERVICRELFDCLSADTNVSNDILNDIRKVYV